jgi:hypothetical protein
MECTQVSFASVVLALVSLVKGQAFKPQFITPALIKILLISSKKEKSILDKVTLCSVIYNLRYIQSYIT